MKEKVKKTLAILLSLVLTLAVFTVAPLTASAEELPTADFSQHPTTIGMKYTFGNGRNMDFTFQGQNGFYAMYSTAVSVGKYFPVETVELCVLDTADNYFKISNGHGGYKEHFKIASSTAGASEAFTKAVYLEDGYSSVIKWVAPKGGEYFVEQFWRCDSNGVFTANNDGIAVGIYKESENIYYHDQTENIADWSNHITSFEKTKADGLVTLEAGEAIYFVSDPKTNGYESSTNREYDAPWTQITIEYRGNAKKSVDCAAPAYSSTDIGTTYSFGKNGDGFTKEGDNGFYALYSMAINKGNNFPIGSFYYAKPITDNRKYFGIPLWNDNSYVGSFQIGSSQLTNVAERSTVSLANGYTAAVKWVAPVAGEYSVNADWRYDGKGVFAKTEDGVDLSVYRDYERLYYNSVGFTDAWAESLPTFNNGGQTISLDRGDALYFIADPKTVAYTDVWDYDAPWLNVDIKLESVMNGKLSGDINGDGSFNVADLMRLKKLYSSADVSQNEIADVDMDGLYNSGDIVKMCRFLLNIDERYPVGATEYIFGDEVFNGMDKQGSSGFYAMYLETSNHGADFPVENLKQMNYYNTKNLQWMPDDSGGTFMYLRAGGTTALQKDMSLAVKWVAQESGTYYIDSYIYGGTREVNVAGDDGIAFGVYKNTERLAYVDKTTSFWIEKETAAADTTQHIIKTVQMNKGDALYFTADPKGIIKSADLPSFYIKISDSNDQRFNHSTGMSSFEGASEENVSAYIAPADYPQYEVEYIVRVNGKSVGVYSDKNTWSKAINFATFEMREGSTVDVEVTPLFTFKKYSILPDKYGIKSNRSGNSIHFKLSDSQAKLSFVFEDNYKNTTLHLFANPIDDNAPTESTEDIIYFGPGYHFLTETIQPKNNQTVYIANGAVVNGGIYIGDKENVNVCGSGVLVRDEGSQSGWRGIRVIDSKDVNISGVTVNINKSAEWSTEIRRSADVNINNYKVVSPQWASTDAIDIVNSQRITVEDCFLRATDDTITLKGLDWDKTDISTLKPSIKTIKVKSSILWNECNNAMVVGEETFAKGYEDIIFEDIDVIFSYDDGNAHGNLLDRAAISIVNYHGANMENITWDNIRINECVRLICIGFFNEGYEGPLPEDECQVLAGNIKNVTIKNVTSNSTSNSLYANEILLKGWSADKKIIDLTLENITANGKKLTSASPLIVKNEFVDNLIVKHN